MGKNSRSMLDKPSPYAAFWPSFPLLGSGMAILSIPIAPYKMTDEVFNSLVELCIDICKRNGKTGLFGLRIRKRLWITDLKTVKCCWRSIVGLPKRNAPENGCMRDWESLHIRLINNCNLVNSIPEKFIQHASVLDRLSSLRLSI